MNALIQPKILKGFRDYLPNAEITRALLTEKITAVFRKFGYVPIDTPVLEYSEILLRKSEGETEKQVFRFLDNGGRDVSMRFDLTVPFARFIAEHKDELYFPFKRYHIAKVWRGEKPQAGRYREFMQCDFDSVGTDSVQSDFEILQVIVTALQAVNVEDFTVKINHRGVFNRFLEHINLKEKSEDILRTVDKLSKIGKEETTALLNTICGSTQKSELILEYIQGFSQNTDSAQQWQDTVSHIEKRAGGEAEDTQRLRILYSYMQAAGIEKYFEINPSITRGLDYYTGVVYETFLNELPSIGSVCSGGRYDNLAGLYMKERVSGVGSSIGLDRLIAALEQLGKTPQKNGFLDAEIFCLDESLAAHYIKTAQTLRSLGINCEVFPDSKKINAQYTVAEKKGIPFGILINAESAQKNLLTLKNLLTRETWDNLTVEEAAQKIKKML